MFWVALDYINNILLIFTALRGLTYVLSKALGLKINLLIFNLITLKLMILSVTLSYFVSISTSFPLSFPTNIYYSIVFIPLLYVGCYYPLGKELGYGHLNLPDYTNYKYMLLWLDQNVNVITIYSVLIYIAIKGIFQ